MAEEKHLLVMEQMEKSFPGVKALDKVTVTLDSGSVHALMGENGAGKSTLMKCLFGVYAPDGGRIVLDGEEIRLTSPKEAMQKGVAMVHQELNQALGLSVSHNMWLGRFPVLSPYLPFTQDAKMHRMTKAVFDDLGIDIDPRAKMSTLSVSKRQMVEIARAVSYDAKVVVLDEPTSSLNTDEANKLFAIIKELTKRGVGIFYISHKMAEILEICDTVTVMRDGRRICTAPAKELDTDKIISLMVGRELTERFPKRSVKPSDVVFKCEGLKGEYSRLRDASFMLRRGEILGVAGLEGSGRTELLEGIFGISKRSGGSMVLEGKAIKNASPREAISNGFALITEERRRSGILASLGITENTVISSLKRYKGRLLLDNERMRSATLDTIKRLSVKTPSEKTRIRTLSGGNQQKVILNRWLLTEPKILLLDEPTRGIDVGAKYEIYLLMQELTEKGMSIIMVSSEMQEILGLCDRIIVMSDGRVVGELDGATADQESIMRLACSEY